MYYVEARACDEKILSHTGVSAATTMELRQIGFKIVPKRTRFTYLICRLEWFPIPEVSHLNEKDSELLQRWRTIVWRVAGRKDVLFAEIFVATRQTLNDSVYKTRTHYWHHRNIIIWKHSHRLYTSNIYLIAALKKLHH